MSVAADATEAIMRVIRRELADVQNHIESKETDEAQSALDDAIRKLKRIANESDEGMDRNQRRLAKKQAPKAVARGIDPSALNEFIIAELARQIHGHLGRAKQSFSVDETLEYLFSKTDLTVKGMADIPIACGRGCSHCCNIWVSATAPEVLFLAKRLSSQAGARVREAHEITKSFSHEQRPYNPHRVLSSKLMSSPSTRTDPCFAGWLRLPTQRFVGARTPTSPTRTFPPR
ncbi:hypothetical protein [Bradyrhizobium sp. WSM471]|uniref:hypothetical protein n=1 Tax=Bradyrhizobium sp. WSM471 TaxID=319017 RepID=UPI000569088C|nr:MULTISPECIES: hypothetical protein [Bradyrhizobium]UFW42903.1 hypothetical protein BcanWSM471_06930 [Bradyrhizobium canariense]